MKKKLSFLLLICFILILTGCFHQDDKEVLISLNKEEFLTDSVLTDYVSIKVINNFNQDIYYFGDCSFKTMAIDELAIDNFDKLEEITNCTGTPSVKVLASGEEVNIIKHDITKPGTYKVIFSYSLEKLGEWEIGDKVEIITDQFQISAIDPSF